MLETPVLARIGFLSLLALTVAVGGCGRRGPLEPPPGTPKQPAAPVVVPKEPAAGAPGGLFRNTTAKTEDTSANPPVDKQPGDKSSFFLDPLL